MKTFISYSRKDALLAKRVRDHLGAIEAKFGLQVFFDRDIHPGEEWEARIWAEFNSSRLILVLVSANFLASEFCYKREFKRAVGRHEARQATVVPIILSHCDWTNVPALSKLQVLPDNAEPISGGNFKTQDQAVTNVIHGLNKLLTSLTTKRRIGARRPQKPALDHYETTPFKAVFFDLDGTLVRGRRGHEYFRYSWQLVWAHLKFPDIERKKYYKQYENKEITYERWCEITKDLFRANGLLKSHFHEMAKKVRLTKNCKETLGILRARGLKTVIVSGGIDTFLEAVFPECYEYFDEIHINRFTYDQVGLLESIRTTPYDFEGKHNAIVDFCRQNGIAPTECVFVGEGQNDVHALKELSRAGGLTIGYPSDRVADYAQHDLWKDRLDAILEIIFQKPVPQKLPLSS